MIFLALYGLELTYFSGDITHLLVEDLDSSTKSAKIVFNSDETAKTACLIDNTSLGGNLIHVKPAVTPAVVAENISSNRSEGVTAAYENHPNGYRFSQFEKPRTRILAEYIAYGYHIANGIIEKGIVVDKANGISAGFQRALEDFDKKFAAWDSKHHVSGRARQTDRKHHILDHAKHVWSNVESCFEKASGTPKGLKLRHLYQDGRKEAPDVHNEARHLADLLNEEHHGYDRKSRSSTESKECTCGMFSVV
jgi:hypothetical protein